MKSKKLLTLSLLATLGLAGCGGGGGGNNKPKIGPWGEELEALMKEALYGEVLPYIDEFKDKEFEFEVFDGKLYIDGEATFTTADVEAYAAQFEGWEDYSEDAGYPFFAKEVEVGGVAHEIDVMFALVDEEGYLAEEEPASLTIIAGDPGAWPADTAAGIIDYLSDGESDAVVPAFEGGTYVEVDTDWIFFGLAAIYVDCTEAQFEDYLDKFVEPAWVLNYSEEDEAYFAVSEDQLIQIDLSFTAYSDGSGGYAYIGFSIYVAPITGWPADDVAAIVESLSPGSSTVIPAFTASEDFEVYSTQIWCTTEDTTAADVYAGILTQASWDVTGPDEEDDGSYEAISPAGDIKLYFYYSADWGQLAIYFYAVPRAEFPLNTVNTFLTTYGLGFQLSEALPDPVGEGYTVSSFVDGSYHGLSVQVSGDQGEAFNNILEPILTAAGYTKSASSGYYSYSNAADHIVNIIYSSTETSVVFWE